MFHHWASRAQGGIDRVVAVRVIALHRLADDARALAGRAAGGEAEVEHRRQDTTLRRFKAVADVGQGAADDDRHRVIEVTLLEFLLDVQGRGPQMFVFGRRNSGAHGTGAPSTSIVGGRRRMQRVAGRTLGRNSGMVDRTIITGERAGARARVALYAAGPRERNPCESRSSEPKLASGNELLTTREVPNRVSTRKARRGSLESRETKPNGRKRAVGWNVERPATKRTHTSPPARS